MLELRPNCELCDADLPPESEAARICSYECTFCAVCVDEVLRNVCPNCGGGFQPRPVRPETARRSGVSRGDQPPSTARVHTRYSREEIDAFTIEIQDVPPAFR
ncbi:MAG: DUF1272 domain-containing protein [Pseudomonadales bacterium]|nr:DUF1272 domain-containing protein [Pseudomonadales bacterium]